MLTGLLIGRPGTTEILIIALVIVLLFGASKIPKLARSMGEAKSEFEKGLDEGRNEDEADEEDDAGHQTGSGAGHDSRPASTESGGPGEAEEDEEAQTGA